MGFFDSLLNIGYQGHVNKQNVALMRESWAREDTAIQRRVADLEAAGLNPVLAAGQGASSSGPISLKAPQVGGLTDEGLAVMSMLRQKMDIAKTEKDIELVDQQIKESQSRTDVSNYNLNESKKMEKRTNDRMTELDSIVSQLQQLLDPSSKTRNLLDSVSGVLKGAAKSMIPGQHQDSPRRSSDEVKPSRRLDDPYPQGAK